MRGKTGGQNFRITRSVHYIGCFRMLRLYTQRAIAFQDFLGLCGRLYTSIAHCFCMTCGWMTSVHEAAHIWRWQAWSSSLADLKTHTIMDFVPTYDVYLNTSLMQWSPLQQSLTIPCTVEHDKLSSKFLGKGSEDWVSSSYNLWMG